MTLSNFSINTPLYFNGVPLLCPFPDGYDNTQPYIITSSDPTVILISGTNGNILVPKNVGTSTITFTQNGNSINTIINVEKLIVNIVPDNVNINYNENIPSTFNYNINPSLETSCDILNTNISINRQKVGYGINLPSLTKISDLRNITINRTDNGVGTNPYINLWVRDPRALFPYSINNYAVISISPNWSGSYNASYIDMENELIYIYETPGRVLSQLNGLTLGFQGTSWINDYVISLNNSIPSGPTDQLILSNLADLIVEAPSVSILSSLSLSSSGYDTGIPRNLSNNVAYGFNWLFGNVNNNGNGTITDYIISNVSVNNEVNFNSYVIRNGNDSNSTPPAITQIPSYNSSNITIGTISTNAMYGSNVGSYNIFPNNFSTTNTNYDIIEHNGTLIITPILPILSWNSLYDINYGTTLSLVQLCATSTDNVDTITYNYPIGTILDAGHNIKLIASQTVTGGNYIPGTYTIENTINVNKLNINISANPQSIIYESTLPQLTYTISPSDLAHNINIDNNTTLISTTANNSSDVGQYPITLNHNAFTTTSPNYNLVFSDSTLNITKHSITITANAKNITYGTSVFNLQYTIQSGYESYVTVSANPVLTTATGIPNVGTYDITLNQSAFSTTIDYTLIFVNSTLTISQCPITITADSKNISYGSIIPTLTYSVQAGYSAYVSGGTLSTNANNSSDHGTYAITLNKQSFTTNSNYTLIFIDSTLIISPYQILVTANPQDTIYGSNTFPQLTYHIDQNYSSHVHVDNTDTVITTTATNTSNVGTYPITFNQSAFTTDSANYSIAFVNSNLVISPKPINIIANSQNMVYSSNVPTLTYTVQSGFENNVTIGNNPISTTATNSSSVGSYPITLKQDVFTTTSNYSLVFTDSHVTITPFAITVNANSETVAYGSILPALGYTIQQGYVSFVSVGSNPISTTATNSSNAGSYPITLDLNAFTVSSLNYTLSLFNSVLTITTIQPTLTWNSLSDIQYGNALSSTQLCATSSNTIDTITYNYTIGTILNVGQNIQLIATQIVSSGGNYTPGTYTLSNTINVYSYNITVSADSKSMIYGDSVPTLTYTISPTAYSSNVVIGANPISTTGTSSSNIGNYDILLNTNTIHPINSNYIITYVNSILTVNKAYSNFNWSPSQSSITYNTTLSNFLNASIPTNAVNGNNIGYITYTTTVSSTLTTLTNSSIVPYSSSPYVVKATLIITDTNYENTNTTHSNLVQTQLLSIVKATPIFTWTPILSSISYGNSLSQFLNAQSPIDPINNSAIGTIIYSTTGISNLTSSTPLQYSPSAYQVTATLTITDNNYNSTSLTVIHSLYITKATPSFTWNPVVSSLTYGSSLSQVLNAVVANDINNNSLVIGTIQYSTPGYSNLVSSTVLPYASSYYLITATLTVTDTNYDNSLPVTQTFNLTINKATPSFTWTPLQTLTYGISLAPFLNAIPLNDVGNNSIQVGTITYSTQGYSNLTPATLLPYSGSPYTVTATLSITDPNYISTPLTQQKTLTITQATPSFTWTPYVFSFVYGTSIAQFLNAQIPNDPNNTSIGNIVYSTTGYPNILSNTILPYATVAYQIKATLTVTDNNYNSSTTLVQINNLTITKATPSFTWNPSVYTLVYGTSLDQVLNAVPANDISNNSTSIGTIQYSTTGYSNLMTSTILPYNTIPYVITATLTVTDNNYNNSSLLTQTKNLTITQATPSFTWTPSVTSFLYGSSLVQFLNAVPINDVGNSSIIVGNITYSTTGYSNIVSNTLLPYSASQYLVTATLNITDNNYSSSSPITQTKNLTINKITPVIQWTPNLTAITYGIPLSSLHLNAVAQNDNVTGNPIGTHTYSITSVGPVSNGSILQASSSGYYITATLNLGSQYTNNYVNNQTSTTSSALIVNKRTATFSWTSSIQSVVFESPLTSSVLNATAIDSIDNVSSLGTITYTATPTTGGNAININSSTNTLSVGTYTLKASLNVTNPNYISTTLTATNPNTLSITREVPHFTWTSSIANINYGTPLSSTQLNATSPIDPITQTPIGIISYNYSIGTILNAGTYTITAYLTVTELTSSDYAIGIYTATNTLTVNKINAPSFVWNTYIPPIPYKCPLSNEELNAIAIDPIDKVSSMGTISYNNPIGTLLNAGKYTLTATLNVTNPNYNVTTQTASNTLTVVPIPPTITYYTPRPISSGSRLTSTQLDATTDLPNGNIVYNVSLGNVISSKTKIIATLTPPYNNSNFIDETVSSLVVLNTF